MNKLIINTLYLFEPSNQLAKRVDFEEGINVITSDKIDGNDVGKSIILKSIYHTLGADSIFDHQWEALSKIYLLHISVNQNLYYVYRSNNLFKIYNNNFNKLFETINRNELGVFLKDLFDFGVILPNKDTEEIEFATPVYSYLLNFVDQDKMAGPKFNSFNALYQYKNDKKAILYNHFGIFTNEYFETIEKMEKLRKENRDFESENQLIGNMLDKLKKYLNGIDIPTNMEVLEIELERTKKEYIEIITDLKKHKNKLIKLRNEKIQLESDIKELIKWKKLKEKDVKAIKDNFCPTCSQEVEEENTKIKITQYGQLEDFYLMKNELDSLLLSVDRHIEINEGRYGNLLSKLKYFEKEININNKEVSSVVKHKGYLETENNLLKEYGEIRSKIDENDEKLKEDNKIIKKYDDLKREANNRYELLMNKSADFFGLEEVQRDKLKTIDGSFNARGSNISITTIIWFYNLLRVKYELNPNAIRLPMILDSPNNVELEDHKLQSLFEFIFEKIDSDTQLIVSTLGFDQKAYPEVIFDKIINLDNKKYNLLNKKDFKESKEILNTVFNEN